MLNLVNCSLKTASGYSPSHRFAEDLNYSELVQVFRLGPSLLQSSDWMLNLVNCSLKTASGYSPSHRFAEDLNYAQIAKDLNYVKTYQIPRTILSPIPNLLLPLLPLLKLAILHFGWCQWRFPYLHTWADLRWHVWFCRFQKNPCLTEVFQVFIQKCTLCGKFAMVSAYRKGPRMVYSMVFIMLPRMHQEVFETKSDWQWLTQTKIRTFQFITLWSWMTLVSRF